MGLWGQELFLVISWFLILTVYIHITPVLLRRWHQIVTVVGSMRHTGPSGFMDLPHRNHILKGTLDTTFNSAPDGPRYELRRGRQLEFLGRNKLTRSLSISCLKAFKVSKTGDRPSQKSYSLKRSDHGNPSAGDHFYVVKLQGMCSFLALTRGHPSSWREIWLWAWAKEQPARVARE